MSLKHVFRYHFPGHRFKDDEGRIVDELSTKGRESNDELQAFNSVLLRDPPEEKKDPRKRCAPNGVPELLKRTCPSEVAQESTPPRPTEIGAPIWEWLRQNKDPVAPAAPAAPAAPISGAPKMVRELPPVLIPSALALELMNDKNYKFIMGLSLEAGRSK